MSESIFYVFCTLLLAIIGMVATWNKRTDAKLGELDTKFEKKLYDCNEQLAKLSREIGEHVAGLLATLKALDGNVKHNVPELHQRIDALIKDVYDQVRGLNEKLHKVETCEALAEYKKWLEQKEKG